MADSAGEKEPDFIASAIKLISGNDEPKLNLWNWPPSLEVTLLINNFLTAKNVDIKTSFSIDSIPKSIPDSSGSGHVVAAHCLIYARTHDLRKGCAMVGKIFMYIEKNDKSYKELIKNQSRIPSSFRCR